MRVKAIVCVCTLALILGVFAGSASAQRATASLRGTVSDATGAVVPEVRVIVTLVDTGVSRELTTNPQGEYYFTALLVGTYTVRFERQGFRTGEVVGLVLDAGSNATLNQTLEVGAVGETVTVEATTPLIDTRTAQIGTTIEHTRIVDLPLNGRDVLDLAVLQPGVIETSGSGGSSPNPISVSGQRSQSNNLTIDGGDWNDLAAGFLGARPNPDAVEEFHITTNVGLAEQGRSSGGQIDLVLRGGSNNWHGSAWEFLRNEKLDATSFFTNQAGGEREIFRRNQFGWAIGGPISIPGFYSGRDHGTYFYQTYEGFRQKIGSTATVFVPAAGNERDGFISCATQPNGVNALGPNFTFVNIPCGTSIVGSGFEDPIAVALRDQFVPLPNTVIGGRSANTFAPGNPLRSDELTVRVDHRISDRQQFFASYFYRNAPNVDPFGFATIGQQVEGFGQTSRSRQQLLNARHTFVTARETNEFGMTFTRLANFAVNPINNTSSASFGINLNPDNPAIETLGQFAILGDQSFTLGSSFQGPQDRADTIWQWRDNFSLIRGNHALKFGGDVRMYLQDQSFAFIDQGVWIFVNTNIRNASGAGCGGGLLGILFCTGTAYQNFLLGQTFEFAQGTQGLQDLRTNSFFFYGQDEWRVRPNVTLTFGLRYEINTGIDDKHGTFDRVATFRNGAQSTVFPNAPLGLLFPGDSDPLHGGRTIGGSTIPNDYNNFAPRFSIAWSPGFDSGAGRAIFGGPGKSSIRGGYALFYDINQTELQLQFLVSPPYNFIVDRFIFTGETVSLAQPYASTFFGPAFDPFAGGAPRPRFAGDTSGPAIFPPGMGLTFIDPTFRTPYSHQFALQWQRDWGSVVTSIGYSGTLGHKLLQRRDFNPFLQACGGAGCFEPAFGGMTIQSTAGQSNYHSLQANVERRFSHGIGFQSAYTWAHCIDTTSGLRDNVRFDDIRGDRGSCDFDVRQRFVNSVVWEFSSLWGNRFSGAAGKALNGWRVSIINTFQTGFPLQIGQSGDPSGTGAGTDRPVFTGPFTRTDPRGTDNQYFDPAAFSLFSRTCFQDTPACEWSPFGRNVFHGPGLNNWDFGLLKRTSITETVNVEFRLEFFNMWNHTQFFQPGVNANSPSTFGIISSARTPRIGQVALKINF